MTGTYDPALNLTYWGVGNPGPDFNPAQRPGDNLYTDSVVALDADTGQAQVALPVHAERSRTTGTRRRSRSSSTRSGRARRRKLMLAANRNGFFYVLDRATGKFLLGKPFIEGELGERPRRSSGRPIQTPQPAGVRDLSQGSRAARTGGPPSYSPRTGLFYISAWEDVSGVFSQRDRRATGRAARFMGGTLSAPTRPAPDAAVAPNIRRDPINTWTDAVGHGVARRDRSRPPARASGPSRCTTSTDSGVLTTASDLLFTGGRDGYFQALDARTGDLLWKSSLGSMQIALGTHHLRGRREAVRDDHRRERSSPRTRSGTTRSGILRDRLAFP